MAIAASSVLPANSLEDFRIEFNNLVSDVTGITATNKFTEDIIFEGATADAYETTLTVTDPTADRTITLPNLTGTVSLITATETLTNKTLTSPAIGTSITHADNVKAYYGTGNDLEIFHDGSHSYVKDIGTGDLKLQASDDIVLEDTSGANAAVFNVDAGQELYWRGGSGAGKKFETTEAGATVTGALDVTTTIQGTTITAETAVVPDASDGAALGTTSLEWSDLYLADGAVIGFGDDQEVTLTHVADTGLLLSSTDQLQFGDSGTYIHQSADGVLDLVSDTEIEINATTIDINGNVEISGDLTVTGDDITMGTNTSGAALIADGTNFNPVVISGDATIATNGALTIASTSVEGSMLNNNVISGQTALTSGVASTDELMISDAGTLKRVDVSLITALATGDATALAIALG